jgi:phosphate/sulfate permease
MAVTVNETFIEGIVNFGLGATAKGSELVYTIINELVTNWGATLALGLAVGAVLFAFKKNLPKLVCQN